MTFSFIHMADIHLDTPFQTRDEYLRKFLRNSIRQAFRSGVDTAIDKKVDAILMSGDVFDNDTLSFSTEKFLINEFSRLNEAGIKVLYAPGNHDPYGQNFRLNMINWPSNVHIYKSTKPEAIPFYTSEGYIKSIVVGAGHNGKREGKNLSLAFPQAEGDIPYIGLLHALVTGSAGESAHERYAPCSMPDLEQKGYAYWALGHVHSRVELNNNPVIIYPGNILGRNPRETGAKGAYLVIVDEYNKINTSFIELSGMRWENYKINSLSDVKNLDELEDKICKQIYILQEKANYSGKILARITLEGPCPLYKDLQDEENLTTLAVSIKDTLGIEYADIKAEGLFRPVEPIKYRNEAHVLGKTLEIIDCLKYDDDLLMSLKPDLLAGCRARGGDRETIDYLHSLLEGLDFEASARLVRGDENGI